MSNVLKRVAGPVLLTSGAVTYYTVPNGFTFRILAVHVANVSASIHSCTIGIGGTSPANQLVPTLSINANDFLEFGSGIVLHQGETLQALADAGSVINLSVHGIESSVR